MQTEWAEGPVPCVCMANYSSSTRPNKTQDKLNPGGFLMISQNCPRFPPPPDYSWPTNHTVVSLPALRLGAENWRLIRGGVTNWL